MKKLTLILCLFIGLGAQAQSKVHPNKLKGHWTLKIDIEKELEEEKEDMDIFERMVVGAVEGLVEGIMEEIDIQFDFKKNGTFDVTVTADDETNTEEGTWEINKKGQLVIHDIDNSNVQVSSDGFWMMHHGKLVPIEDGEIKKNVYMIKGK
ncbi:hypothetical protein N9L20_02490 [Flavobacteriaceae bacterium]|nr:hypothetical protein [Flavobacteriaceae bacterium]